MKVYKYLGCLLMACWVSMVSAGPEATPASAEATSAVSASNEEKKISTDPEHDYQEGLKILATAGQDMTAAVQAAIKFKLAANAGHAGAQAQFAIGLERGQFLDEAIDFYRMSAAQGHMDGQYGLGSIYMLGEGIPQDFAEARKWLSLAGAQEHKVAIHTMADAYIRRELSADEISALLNREVENYTRAGLGLDAAARQSPDALVWIKRAADINYPPALNALAAAYRTGQFGLEVDTNKADEIVAQGNKAQGITSPAVRKRSALYKLLRGDDSKKKPEETK